jgi:hypothetical protein
MARSRKKAPFVPVSTSTSEKADKVAAHRKERRKVRTILAVKPDVEVLPHRRRISNVWAYAKDGKRYLKSPRPKDLRK